MAIWSAEIKELERLNASLIGHFSELEKEMGQLVRMKMYQCYIRENGWKD